MPANLHHAQEYIRRQIGPEYVTAVLRESKEADDGPSVAAPPVTESGPEKIRAVEFVATIEDAVRSADLAIDCVPDELESKLEILWLLDRMAPPQTVFATPTTRLSISDLAACTYRAGQCVAIAMEASALARLDPGAEILLRTTAATTPTTVAFVERFWHRLGFAPRFAPDNSQ